jgi:predicted NBD/HSP70 family sugar kinase
MVLGVALGTESCRAGLIDANGQVFCAFEGVPVPHQAKLPPDEFLARIAKAVEQVLSDAYEVKELTEEGELPLIGLATALPCPVRGSKRPAGSILNSEWMTYKPGTLPEAIAKATGLPASRVHVLNDANAHLMAIAFDDSRAKSSNGNEQASRIALLLRIGGGIGASTMILAPRRKDRLSFVDSVMLGGARNLAGELAHLPIDAAVVEELNERARWVDGLAPLSTDWRCSCGHSSHLEALASGTAWTRRMAESDIDISPLLTGTGRHPVSRTSQAIEELLDDARVSYALEDLGRLIGRSLSSPILLLDPHSLFLTGSFAVEPVVNGILAERETWRHVFGDALNVSSVSGSDARFLGVRGAGLAVLRSHVFRRLHELLGNPDWRRELIFAP